MVSMLRNADLLERVFCLVLFVFSVWGVVWGYFVYFLASDLGSIIIDILRFHFNLGIFKLVTLYLCPLVYILISICLIVRVAGWHNIKRRIFIFLSVYTAVFSLWIYGYILMAFMWIDLYHAGFSFYAIILVWNALRTVLNSEDAAVVVLPIVVAVIALYFMVGFNACFGWRFPLPFY